MIVTYIYITGFTYVYIRNTVTPAPQSDVQARLTSGHFVAPEVVGLLGKQWPYLSSQAVTEVAKLVEQGEVLSNTRVESS